MAAVNKCVAVPNSHDEIFKKWQGKLRQCTLDVIVHYMVDLNNCWLRAGHLDVLAWLP